MGNAIENRARVELEPLGPPEPGPAEGWQVYQVQVVAAEDVAGYPNLLAADLPRELEALVPAELADRVGPAAPWRVAASLVAPGRIRVEAPG